MQSPYTFFREIEKSLNTVRQFEQVMSGGNSLYLSEKLAGQHVEEKYEPVLATSKFAATVRGFPLKGQFERQPLRKKTQNNWANLERLKCLHHY